MQLNLTTDYAIRTLLYLATTNRITSSTEISEKMYIQNSYILTITRKLRDAGMIESRLGSNGGHRLAKHPSEISLLEVVELMENTIKINRCLEDDHFCSRLAIDYCSVQKVYTTLQKDFEDTLRNTTLESLINKVN